MFQLGLFENPYVDPAGAEAVVARKDFLEAGHRAQVQSLVLLKNADGLLPAAGKKLYVENLSREIAAGYGAWPRMPKRRIWPLSG